MAVLCPRSRFLAGTGLKRKPSENCPPLPSRRLKYFKSCRPAPFELTRVDTSHHPQMLREFRLADPAGDHDRCAFWRGSARRNDLSNLLPQRFPRHRPWLVSVSDLSSIEYRRIVTRAFDPRLHQYSPREKDRHPGVSPKATGYRSGPRRLRRPTVSRRASRGAPASPGSVRCRSMRRDRHAPRAHTRHRPVRLGDDVSRLAVDPRACKRSDQVGLAGHADEEAGDLPPEIRAEPAAACRRRRNGARRPRRGAGPGPGVAGCVSPSGMPRRAGCRPPRRQPRARFLEMRPGPRRELAAGRLAPVEYLGDPGEFHVEDVVEQEGRTLQRREPLERQQQGHREVVGQLARRVGRERPRRRARARAATARRTSPAAPAPT